MGRPKNKAKEPNKRPRGRPSKYKPEYCTDLIDHMRQGGSYEGFGAYIGEKYGREHAVHIDTLYEWEKVYPDFSESKRLALQYARRFWDDLTMRGVAGQLRRVSKEVYGPPDPVTGKQAIVSREYEPATFAQSFAIFTYKNRFGWRDRVEHTGNEGGPIRYQDAQSADLDKKLSSILERLRILDDEDHGPGESS